MKVYEVIARRWKRGWELHIEDVGVTQAKKLRDADMMARDLIERRTGEPADSFEVCVVPDLGGLEKAALSARERRAAAEAAIRAAAAESRDLARKLRSEGLSGDDTAAVLGVSKGRVSQLAKQ